MGDIDQEITKPRRMRSALAAMLALGLAASACGSSEAAEIPGSDDAAIVVEDGTADAGSDGAAEDDEAQYWQTCYPLSDQFVESIIGPGAEGQKSGRGQTQCVHSYRVMDLPTGQLADIVTYGTDVDPFWNDDPAPAARHAVQLDLLVNEDPDFILAQDSNADPEAIEDLEVNGVPAILDLRFRMYEGYLFFEGATVRVRVVAASDLTDLYEGGSEVELRAGLEAVLAELAK